MAETASSGFVARNNEVIGSVLSIIALLIAALLGAGLMFGTDTRGVRAILTVLTIAGGTFTLLLILIGRTLETVTPQDQWEREENDWRSGMSLPPLGETEPASALARLRVPLAVLAILVGLALSVVPDIL